MSAPTATQILDVESFHSTPEMNQIQVSVISGVSCGQAWEEKNQYNTPCRSLRPHPHRALPPNNGVPEFSDTTTISVVQKLRNLNGTFNLASEFRSQI